MNNEVRVLLAAGALFAAQSLWAQDSVDVTFRYVNSGVSGVTVPGEFNGWDNTAWPMTNQGGGIWTRTARLRLGGNPSPPAMGIPGAWQYKFFPAGTTGAWPNDPLNHHQNPNDNNNTFLYTKDPTIYQILPNQREPLVTTSTPTISAYIFPKVGTSVDTAYIIHLNNVYTFARRAGGTMPSRDFRLIINDDVLPGKGQGTMAR